MANDCKPLPRGLRNNNPGNIRRSGEKWKGLKPIQEDKDFFQFRSRGYGYRALIRTLQTYRSKYGVYTIADMIRRWAPPIENDTSAYIRRVCQRLMVPTDYIPDTGDKATMCAIAAAISLVENGREAVMEEVEDGWRLLQTGES